jgi:hypothetical protein
VPPAFLSPAEVKMYSEHFQEFWTLSGETKFDEAQIRIDEMEKLGTFLPCFMHHPDEGLIRIYPTIPADIAHLLAIGRIVVDNLNRTSGGPIAPTGIASSNQ